MGTAPPPHPLNLPRERPSGPGRELQPGPLPRSHWGQTLVRRCHPPEVFHSSCLVPRAWGHVGWHCQLRENQTREGAHPQAEAVPGPAQPQLLGVLGTASQARGGRQAGPRRDRDSETERRSKHRKGTVLSLPWAELGGQRHDQFLERTQWRHGDCGQRRRSGKRQPGRTRTAPGQAALTFWVVQEPGSARLSCRSPEPSDGKGAPSSFSSCPRSISPSGTEATVGSFADSTKTGEGSRNCHPLGNIFSELLLRKGRERRESRAAQRDIYI